MARITTEGHWQLDLNANDPGRAAGHDGPGPARPQWPGRPHWRQRPEGRSPRHDCIVPSVTAISGPGPLPGGSVPRVSLRSEASPLKLAGLPRGLPAAAGGRRAREPGLRLRGGLRVVATRPGGQLESLARHGGPGTGNVVGL